MYLEDIFHFIVVAKHKQKQCPIFELIVLYLPRMMIGWQEHCHVGSASPITVWWSFFRSFTRFPIFSQQLFLGKNWFTAIAFTKKESYVAVGELRQTFLSDRQEQKQETLHLPTFEQVHLIYALKRDRYLCVPKRKVSMFLQCLNDVGVRLCVSFAE